MARKIYDIVPPKVARKIEKNIKEFFDEEKDSPVRLKTGRYRRQNKKKERSLWRTILIGGAAVVLFVAVYLFFKLPKADIQVWPKVDVLSFEQTITADKSIDSIDETKALVPAQYLEFTKTETESFPATGSASDEGKAKGTITVYNKNDPTSSVTLKTGTHFLSDSGKYFVTLEKIIIPAGTKKGGKVTPGSIRVKVEAAESGPGYNIAPASFSVPKLSGTAYYYSIYATSDSDMAGGYTGKVKKVTDDDIQTAKDVITKKAISDAEKELKNQISSDSVLLDDAIVSIITSASTQTKTGAITENFSYEATAKASALAFKKSDLENFAKHYIISQVPEGKTLLDSSFKIDYSVGTLDAKSGKITLKLNFSSGVYQNVDKNSLALSLIGKNAGQINDIIDGSFGDNISKVKINLWPFWVRSAPNNQKKVNIYLNFE